MNEKTKESKFLDAINKYAEGQKARITQEIEDYKNSKIEQATEHGLKDAYDLIKGDIAARKAAIVNDTAKKELGIRRELYKKRQTIRNEVFAEAEQKLLDFTKSEDYKEYLRKQAEKALEVLGEDGCTVYISPADEDKKDIILGILKSAEIKTDNHITIGGLRAYSRKMGITADCTLDTALEDQSEWFNENSGLKVV